MKCKICNNEYTFKRNSSCSKEVCSRCYQVYRKYELKYKSINYKGGKCSICGYSKCKDSLSFHHIDPESKEFTISGKYNLSWKKISKELDKCILVCMNCHGEIHSNKENEYKYNSVKKIHKKNETRIRIKSKYSGYCLDCGIRIPKANKRCKICNNISKRKVKWPTKGELLEMILGENSISSIAKKYGVTFHVVKKWIRLYGISSI